MRTDTWAAENAQAGKSVYADTGMRAIGQNNAKLMLKITSVRSAEVK
jgi:hypothetical protein